MKVGSNSGCCQRATLPRRRGAAAIRATRTLTLALGLCTAAACSEDDDGVGNGSPASILGPSDSTTGGGNTGTAAGGTSGGAASGTAASGGNANANSSGNGMIAATGTGATGAATGTGADPATGVTAGATAGTGGSAGATGGTAAGAGGSAGTIGNATGTTASDAGADAGGAAAAAATDLEDGQILFVVDTINAGEVDQARAALPGLEDDAIRAYAQLMIEEHEPARDRLLTLAETQDIALAASPVATELRDQSEVIISQLLALSGDALESAYLDAQVTAHGQALQLIDAMIPAADSEPLDAELTQLRGSVAGHLESAQQLRDATSD